jgi:hypothetical protein
MGRVCHVAVTRGSLGQLGPSRESQAPCRPALPAPGGSLAASSPNARRPSSSQPGESAGQHFRSLRRAGSGARLGSDVPAQRLEADAARFRRVPASGDVRGHPRRLPLAARALQPRLRPLDDRLVRSCSARPVRATRGALACSRSTVCGCSRALRKAGARSTWYPRHVKQHFLEAVETVFERLETISLAPSRRGSKWQGRMGRSQEFVKPEIRASAQTEAEGGVRTLPNSVGAVRRSDAFCADVNPLSAGARAERPAATDG